MYGMNVSGVVQYDDVSENVLCNKHLKNELKKLIKNTLLFVDK